MKPSIRLIPVAAAALAAGLLFVHPWAGPGGANAIVSGPAATGRSTSSPAASSGWSTASPLPEPKAKRTVAPSAVVYVAGAVRRPGVYAVPASARVGDALARAGGGRLDADLVAVNLAARLHDGEEIAVPVLGTEPPARPRETGGQIHRRKRGAQSDATVADAGRGDPVGHKTRRGTGRNGRRAHRADAPPPDSVDLNSADEKTLETLPGVGPALAARIVLFRDANGAFGSIDELLDVSGVTERRLELISPYVEVR
jgi:competence protein ComEA